MYYRYELKMFGVKEVNVNNEDDFMFWNFNTISDISMIKLSNGSSSYIPISLIRTRDWLIENHPELLI
jgi:hypothetical protein